MEIVECENTKQIPSVELRCYSLDSAYTVDSAVTEFKRHFRREPQKAYRWGNYLYIEIGE